MQGGGDGFPVAVVPLVGSNNLIILVAFAGHQDDVLLARLSKCQVDGPDPVVFHLHRRGIAKTRHHVGHDPGRILGAGIVVGQDHPIRKLFRHGGHHGTLAAIPVATTAHQTPELALAVHPQGLQRLLQGIRGVGIIDHGQRRIATAETLHAASHWLQLRRGGQQGIEVVAQHQHDPHGRQHIADVEAAEQGGG